MPISRFVIGAALTVVAAGCAPVNYQGYQGPSAYDRNLHELRLGSISLVEAYAAQVAKFLKSNKEAAAIENAKKAIADSLKDPSSAQFRNVRIVKYGDGSVVCGEVNGKNSYGGYVGFKTFVAGTSSGEIANIRSGKYAEIDQAASAGIYAACG